jgi:hypothetical protein
MLNLLIKIIFINQVLILFKIIYYINKKNIIKNQINLN